ncbi:MAG: hypothetical protein ACE15C_06405 [Phycisphaerae bacterium]
MTNRLPSGWLQRRLREIGKARVAVFGDFCLDEILAAGRPAP